MYKLRAFSYIDVGEPVPILCCAESSVAIVFPCASGEPFRVKFLLHVVNHLGTTFVFRAVLHRHYYLIINFI